MYIVYNENEVRSKFASTTPYSDLDATRFWGEHQKNWFYLRFFSTNPLATFQEKKQAELEMIIAEKKMAYWRKHPNWSHSSAERIINTLRNEWGTENLLRKVK